MKSRFEKSRDRLQARAAALAGDTAVFKDEFLRSGGGSFRANLVPITSTWGNDVVGVDRNYELPKAQFKATLPVGVQVEVGETILHIDGREFQVVEPIHRRDSLGWVVPLSLTREA